MSIIHPTLLRRLGVIPFNRLKYEIPRSLSLFKLVGFAQEICVKNTCDFFSVATNIDVPNERIIFSECKSYTHGSKEAIGVRQLLISEFYYPFEHLLEYARKEYKGVPFQALRLNYSDYGHFWFHQMWAVAPIPKISVY